MTSAQSFDPFVTAVIANRIDGIVREMTYALQRSARSAVINSARDFSCSICTADNELLASAEGLPIHIFGSHLQTRNMSEIHAGDLKEGDCYLHNDPYSGNSHAADHVYLVPVFIDGEHMFTTVVKAHQADIGNSIPSTMNANARDQYEEGALIFPAVRVQRDYTMLDDIVRMCRSRIRVPNQWYGDFLGGIGSARVGERRLKELCEKYGKEQIRTFVRDWLNYSEQRMTQAIKQLPAVKIEHVVAHDKLGTVLPDGIRLHVGLEIDSGAGEIRIDLTNNIDNVDCGLNLTEACAQAAAVCGVLNSLGPSIPRNSGSFRRIAVALRDGCVVGRPKFPHSCSLATTNLAERLINLVQSAFARIDENLGLAEGGVGMGGGNCVVSGLDPRSGNTPFVDMLIFSMCGGPASPTADGWPTYGQPVVASLMYRDSIEIDELKHPLIFRYLRIVPGTAAAGRYRGAPQTELSHGPTEGPMQVIWTCDGTYVASKGVRGGHDGGRAQHFLENENGEVIELDNVVDLRLKPGQFVSGKHSSGGGFGDPLLRDAAKVLKDVLEGYETRERAADIYGVIIEGEIRDESLRINAELTDAKRASARFHA